MDAVIHVSTPTRLHFGLLHVPAAAAARWPSCAGGPGWPTRNFGGLGLMIDSPRVEAVVADATDWAGRGPHADRAVAVARRFVDALPEERRRPVAVDVLRCPPAHVGFGVGTQLALAVARGVARLRGLDALDAHELAVRAGRGARSAIGVHGFSQGGFLLDGGRSSTNPGPGVLLARHEFPRDWRVLLLSPAGVARWSGEPERAAFEQSAERTDALAVTERLCRIALAGVWPALTEQDFETFGEALFEYNRLAGTPFAPTQGGDYAAPEVEALVRWLRREGVRGAGQSSWGPTTFAVVADPERAEALRARARARWPEVAAEVAAGANRGAEIVAESRGP
jgi:beta-RFAP synthase